MSEKSERRRTGLGKGLGALIPSAPNVSRPVDVFFPDSNTVHEEVSAADLRAAVDTETGLAASHEVTRRVTTADSNDSSTLLPVPGATFAEIPIDLVTANPNQPRTVFDEDDLAELAASIREVGVLQPIVVRPSEAGDEIVMGERRWRASRLAGL